MLQKLKKKLKKKHGVQAGSQSAIPSPTLSHASLSTNLSAQQALVPCDQADPILPFSPPSELPAAERINPPTPSGSKVNAPSCNEPTCPPTPPSWMDNVFRVSKTILKTLAILTGAPGLDSFVESLEVKQVMQPILTKEGLEEYCRHLSKCVEEIKGLNASPKLKDNLEKFDKTLSQISQELHDGEDNTMSMERICRKITQTMHSFMLLNCISGIIKIEDALIGVEKHDLHQCIQNIPHVDAAYNDYETQKKSGACFEGTREALLEEIGVWISALEILQIYLLSGIAGIGKSTIAYTVAKRAEQSGYLGASFFFSRDEVERSNAKRFFTTIAFQLCLYSKVFAHAIEKALLTERGLAAVAKDPITQLEALIIDPLRDIVKSRSDPVVTVVDALDECDDRDAPIILAALSRLVQELPCFKVIVTTRPQTHLPPLPNVHKVFHLQDIEERIIDSDIRLYLEHSLSRENVLNVVPQLRKSWGASSQDIDILVQAAGQLFIIASTTVRFVLSRRFGDPEHQMKGLRGEIERNRLSFKDLDRFYTIILRSVIDEDSDKDTKERYQDIIGTIIVIQDPLPIETLDKLTASWSVDAIGTLLGDLRSVILVKDDTPRIYHKSFFDFVTRCKDDDLRIMPKKHHTRLVIRCFETMNAHLRQNILDLGTPARFMNNAAGLTKEKISAERLMDKIPRELQYACTYWANHLEGADPEDADLLREVDTFIKDHLLHWLEALSLISKLEVASDALRVILKFMNSISSDVHGIISDALLFISKFYDRIHQAALHTYYSCLSFTPTQSLLLESYSKDTVHCLCRPEGVPAQWDPLITQINVDEWFDLHRSINVMSSSDSSKFALDCINQKKMKLFKAENGTLLRTFEGDMMSIAHDFSVVAVLQDSAVTLWSVASNVPIATVTQSNEVVGLALSFDRSRLAMGLSNGTVDLWDPWKGELISNLVGYAHDGSQLEFAPSGYRLAFVSGDGRVKLWDGRDGKLVANLDFMSKKHNKFVFSRDGCRLASLVREGGEHNLTLWGSEKGNLIGIAENVQYQPGDELVISDGSIIATGGEESVQLWNGNSLLLLDTIHVEQSEIYSLAISRDLLAIGCRQALRLYDINNHTFIVTLQQGFPFSLAFSPDFTRLAVGTPRHVFLYDVPTLKAFTTASMQQRNGCVYALAFSSDSTRLASGFEDGTVQLWDTTHSNQSIATHKLHSHAIKTVAFSLDGDQFASGSDDKMVRLWDGRNGAPLQLLEHSFDHGVMAVAFSRSLFAASTEYNITLFDRQSLHIVDALKKGSYSLSFSADGCFLASAMWGGDSLSDATVWNVDGWVAIAEFRVGPSIDRLTFSPNNSQLAAQLSSWSDGIFKFFDIVNKRIELTGDEDLRWISNFMNGVLISWRWEISSGGCLIGRFVGHPDWVPILWIPSEFNIMRFSVAPSMVALGCIDGRVLFVRF